jgi:hypothetical protein
MRHNAEEGQMTIDPLQVKRDSEKIIAAAGGRTLDWLPVLEPKSPRSNSDLINRALIVNAMLNIYFEAPIPIIAEWISKYDLDGDLSDWERGILSKTNTALTDQEKTNLYWSIEALWALMWCGSLIDDLHVDQPVEDNMVTLVPNLQRGEGTEKFTEHMKLRSVEELYRMLDLYYRAHWYATDGKLNGYPTGAFSIDIITERRKVLEWILDPSSDWDNPEMST